MDFDPVTFADPTQGVGDPGCYDPTWIGENPQCSDGVDNDGDGLVDFDGGVWIHGDCTGGVCPPGVSDPDGDGVPDPDPQCVDRPYRNVEKVRTIGCGLGAELVLLLGALMLGSRRWRGRARR